MLGSKVYVQAKPEPIRMARNNLALKLLQYARDEAHRFAQQYHHILRRKTTLEEDVKTGRRPPRKKSARTAPQGGTAQPADAKTPGEMPFSTHIGLPILQASQGQAAENEPVAPLDVDDVPADES